MKTIVKTALVALAMGAASLTTAVAQDVKVGVDSGPYPPFSSPDASGKWVGWEVEIMDALCAEAKLNCTLTPIAFDGLIPALNGKKIDAIMSSMSITDERKKMIDFSDKYYNTPSAIIGPKGEKFEPTAEGLKGKIVGVQASTIHQRYVQKYFGSAISELKEYQSQDEANSDLAAGRIDAGMANMVVVQDSFLATPQGKGFAFFGPEYTEDKYFGEGTGIALRKKDSKLRDTITGAIKTIRENGTYAKINAKYFPFDVYGK